MVMDITLKKTYLSGNSGSDKPSENINTSKNGSENINLRTVLFLSMFFGKFENASNPRLIPCNKTTFKLY